MKVEKVKKEFEPRIITIENQEELEYLRGLLRYGKYYYRDNIVVGNSLYVIFANQLLNELNK